MTTEIAFFSAGFSRNELTPVFQSDHRQASRAYNLLRTVMAVATSANGVEPRRISFKGAKQALTAFAPKLEAARPRQRARLVDAMLKAVAYHRVGDRPGRWPPHESEYN
jgi:hypothetical protein